VLEYDIKENFLFCEPIDGRTVSQEVFNIINHFLEENEINWENLIGLCSDRGSPVNVDKMKDFRCW